MPDTNQAKVGVETEVESEETAWERQRRLRQEAAQSLGVPILPLNLLLHERTSLDVTERKIEMAFGRELEELSLDAVIHSYEVSEVFHSRVKTSGIPYDPRPWTEELVLVRVWYYLKV